jgi:aspartyl protease family protein
MVGIRAPASCADVDKAMSLRSDEGAKEARRMGLGMLIAAWMVVIGLVTALFQGWWDNANNPNAVPQSRSFSNGRVDVTLSPNRHGHYVATGELNGTAVEFLLDTGATTVAVPVDVARAVGLRRGAPVTLNTANGTAQGFRTRIDRVRLGDVELKNVAAVIAPGLEDGVLLGMSFLKRLDWRRENGRLVLTSAAR